MEEKFKLKSGRELDPNCGFIGCFKDEKGEWSLSDGYDSHIYLDKWDDEANDIVPDFTSAELIELAEIMIRRWNMFIADVAAGFVPVKEFNHVSK